MSRPLAPGSRRGSALLRRLPDGLPRLGATWAVKSLAGVAILSSAAVVLALPTDASVKNALALPSAPTVALTQRAADQPASRAALRVAPPAVVAPAAAAPATGDKVGLSTPHAEWVLRLKNHIYGVFLSEPFANRPYFDQSEVLHTFEGWIKGGRSPQALGHLAPTDHQHTQRCHEVGSLE